MSNEEKPVFKMEVSIPQARSLLQSFKENRVAALNRLSHDLRSRVQDAVNELLNAEIELFLSQEIDGSNKRNGYKYRSYALKGFGGLRVCVPRDRKGEFESQVIPSGERMDPRIREDIAILQLAGLSNRTLSLVSRRLLGINVGKDLVNDSLCLIREEALRWLERPLGQEDYWALFVDGTNFKIRRRDSVEPGFCI